MTPSRRRVFTSQTKRAVRRNERSPHVNLSEPEVQRESVSREKKKKKFKSWNGNQPPGLVIELNGTSRHFTLQTRCCLLADEQD